MRRCNASCRDPTICATKIWAAGRSRRILLWSGLVVKVTTADYGPAVPRTSTLRHAVQDHIRLRRSDLHGLLQRRGERGRHAQRLTEVPIRGGRAHAEPSGQVAISLALAQM